MKSLDGKRVVVTGAGSGIGKAISLALANKNCNLFLVDRSRERLAKVAEEARSANVEVMESCIDICRPEQITESNQRLLRNWKGLDILVNNAGVCFYGLSVEMSEEDWNEILAVNFLAPIQFTRELLPSLLSNRQSHIVNVSSMYGLFASARSTAYHATKYGLVGFSEALRAEYTRFGMGVTALCPGFVDSNLFRQMKHGHGNVRRPPKWACSSAELVAKRTVKAIYRNRRIVLTTPLAYLGYYGQRFVPGLLAFIMGMGRKKQLDASSLNSVLKFAEPGQPMSESNKTDREAA